MSPRVRKDGNDHLPPNLYRRERGNSYRYRDPASGKRTYVPGPEASAIAYARKRNAGLGIEKSTSIGFLLQQYEVDRLRGSESTRREASRIIEKYRRAWGEQHVRSITRLALNKSWKTLDGPHAVAKHRNLWIQFMRWAVAEGHLDTNEAELTLAPIAPPRARQRHTDEGYAAIYAAAPDWLQIAMELAVSSLQRRGDLLRLTREDVRDNVLYVKQAKTGVRLGIRFTTHSRLGVAVKRAMTAPVFGSNLIRRLPDRRRTRTNGVNESLLTHAFADCRDSTGIYSHLGSGERPSFHDLRAYGVWTYERAGFERTYVQALAGHSTLRMTAHYSDGHDIVWKPVEAGL
jgi:hypothetical protein